ncbi:hypothetical protein [Dactylosporangium sp. CA-092794]|uniref:hypothetical protein n=1 Tax=Dactylosporangium sp. CA-092794 TaxID=3239929 RepID=UPI003D90CC0B
MEQDTSPQVRELAAEQARAIRQAVLDSGIPVVGLAAGGLPAGRLAGVERSDDQVTNVRIRYGGTRDGEPLASVETSRWAGTRVDAGPLRRMVEHHMRLHGERLSAVEWTEADATIQVDGQPVPGRIVRAGGQWWAARCARDGIEISIVARDWHPDAIAVTTLDDLRALLDAPRPERPAAGRDRPGPEPLPEELRREPYRALLDTVLANRARHQAWLADGGPVPQLPRYWSTLWKAAVQRHADLADVPPETAREAVQEVVDHVSDLQQHAAWFRDDERLRDRAISETLLFATGLGREVPSRAAQEAYTADRRARRGLAPGPLDHSEAEARWGATQDWLGAWAAWSADRRG